MKERKRVNQAWEELRRFFFFFTTSNFFFSTQSEQKTF